MRARLIRFCGAASIICGMVGLASLDSSGIRLLTPGELALVSGGVTCHNNSQCMTGAIDCDTWQSVADDGILVVDCPNPGGGGTCSYCFDNVALLSCRGGQTGKCYRDSEGTQDCLDACFGTCNGDQCTQVSCPGACADAEWNCDSEPGACP